LKLTIGHVCVIALASTFVILGADKAGDLRKPGPAYVPPTRPAPAAAAARDPDAGKPPPHNDTVEDLPDGAGREVTFHTCTACHGVALIKAQGMTRELWSSSFDLMLERHRMPPVKAAEREEILDYLAEQFPPRRKRRGGSGENPFLK
jgi:hypothetical protein